MDGVAQACLKSFLAESRRLKMGDKSLSYRVDVGDVDVGVGSKGNQPEIIINRTSSISEGADFSAQLLKLTRIIE